MSLAGGESKAAFESLDGGGTFVVQFNPKEFTIDKGVTWQEAKEQGKDNQPLQYQKGAPMTCSFELYFDSTVDGSMSSVNDRYISKLIALAAKPEIDATSGTAQDTQKKRPRHFLFTWGSFRMECVFESISTTYLMFSSSGAPVRARVSVKLKEWKESYGSASGVAGGPSAARYKLVDSGGQTLSQIAQATGVPMRQIAAANGGNIDPLNPPRTLVIPVNAGGQHIGDVNVSTSGISARGSIGGSGMLGNLGKIAGTLAGSVVLGASGVTGSYNGQVTTPFGTARTSGGTGGSANQRQTGGGGGRTGGGSSDQRQRGGGGAGGAGGSADQRQAGGGQSRAGGGSSDQRQAGGGQSRAGGGSSDQRQRGGGGGRTGGGSSDQRQAGGSSGSRTDHTGNYSGGGGGGSSDQRQAGGSHSREGGGSSDQRQAGGSHSREGGGSSDQRQAGGSSGSRTDHSGTYSGGGGGGSADQRHAGGGQSREGGGSADQRQAGGHSGTGGAAQHGAADQRRAGGSSGGRADHTGTYSGGGGGGLADQRQAGGHSGTGPSHGGGGPGGAGGDSGAGGPSINASGSASGSASIGGIATAAGKALGNVTIGPKGVSGEVSGSGNITSPIGTITGSGAKRF